MSKRKSSFQPLVVYDAMGYVRQYWLAAEKDGEVVRLIMNDTTKPHLYGREVLVGQLGPAGGRTRYVISEEDPQNVASKMLRHAENFGATPEAIRLLGLVTPISKEELSTMANKLAPKKGDKEGLKAAAKSAPVGGGSATAAKKTNKGNPAGLAKAREAATQRKAALLTDKRKLVLTDKGKEKLKTGDATKGSIKNLATMRDAKTIAAAAEAGLTMNDINYAIKTGTIAPL